LPLRLILRLQVFHILRRNGGRRRLVDERSAKPAALAAGNAHIRHNVVDHILIKRRARAWVERPDQPAGSLDFLRRMPGEPERTRGHFFKVPRHDLKRKRFGRGSGAQLQGQAFAERTRRHAARFKRLYGRERAGEGGGGGM